jgi:hypothetical protein
MHSTYLPKSTTPQRHRRRRSPAIAREKRVVHAKECDVLKVLHEFALCDDHVELAAGCYVHFRGIGGPEYVRGALSVG